MRLIDADKITFFDCLAKTGNSVCCHAKGIVSKEGIDMQPTVKAIPIEWLKNYEKEKGQEARLQEALSAWEKENGTE